MNRITHIRRVIFLGIAGLLACLSIVWLWDLSYFIAAPLWIVWVVFLIWVFRD